MAGEKRILVFAERGTDWHMLAHRLRETFARAASPVAIVPVTAAQMREPGMMDPDKTLGFCLPGGRDDADYDIRMGADNIQRLRAYVMNGGRFIGICAGAYYACQSIEWFAGNPAREKKKRPGINFFEYDARGPIHELLDSRLLALDGPQVTLSRMAAAEITFDNGDGRPQRARVMYWGGPQLDGASPGTVLAHFNDVAGRPPAIVMRPYGKGRALISAVHPEIRGEEFIRAVNGTDELSAHGRRIGAVVRQNEESRAMVWRGIMQRMFPEYIR